MSERLTLRVQPRNVDAANAAAIDERTHECVRSLVEHAQVHAEIADVEVGGLRVVTEAAGLSHHGDVDAGLSQVADILNWNVGDAPAVGPRFGSEASDVNAIDEKIVLEGLQKVANRISLGLILAALIVGASMLMRVDTPFRILGYPGFAMIFFLLAALAGCGLAITIVLTDVKARKTKR